MSWSGKVQEFRQDIVETGGLLHDDRGETLLPLLTRPLMQEFRGAPDDPQGIADFMGNPGDHLAQGSETLRLVQLLLELDPLGGPGGDDALRPSRNDEYGREEYTHEDEEAQGHDELEPLDDRIVSGDVLDDLVDAEDFPSLPTEGRSSHMGRYVFNCLGLPLPHGSMKK